MVEFRDAVNDNADAAEFANVRIAKSFKDMADQALSALSGLAGAIKGGGFLDILQGVIGLGLQLGSVGAFGKRVASRINAPQIPSPGSGFGSKGGAPPVKIDINPSPLFTVAMDGRVQRAAPGIANMASRQMSDGLARQRKWRLA